MTREQKAIEIEELKEQFNNHPFFYITDSSEMTVEDVNKLRRLCFEKGLKMKVVKNTLMRKALEAMPEENGYDAIFDALKGPTTVMFSENSSAPAKVIDEFRQKSERPILKAAYIEKDVFIGDENLDMLKALKSKEDLIGDIILLLQSPMKNVVGSLSSSGNTLSGLLKALEERAQ